MPFLHKELASGRWLGLTIFAQMANIGSEVERVISWRKKGDLELSRLALYRALDLIDLTKTDPKWKEGGRLKELCRLREILCDFFAGENQYQTTDEGLQKYFYQFTYAARKDR